MKPTFKGELSAVGTVKVQFESGLFIADRPKKARGRGVWLIIPILQTTAKRLNGKKVEVILRTPSK